MLVRSLCRHPREKVAEILDRAGRHCGFSDAFAKFVSRSFPSADRARCRARIVCERERKVISERTIAAALPILEDVN